MCINAVIYRIDYKQLINGRFKTVTFLAIVFIAHPAGYSINAHSVFFIKALVCPIRPLQGYGI